MGLSDRINRLFLHSYRVDTKLSEKHPRLNVYFENSNGEKYIWAPDWDEGVRQLFMEAYRLQNINAPQHRQVRLQAKVVKRIPGEEPQQEETIDFQFLAVQLGKTLGSRASDRLINKVAKDTFNFKAVTHEDSGMSTMNSQNIYDWIMTLSTQPLNTEMKLKLLKQFASALAPKDSPLSKLAE